jgi:hypothetical protein
MFIRKTTYDTFKNNIQFLTKQNSVLRADNIKWQEKNIKLAADNEKLACDIDDLKKQVKKLKTFCTKNGLDYSVLYTKEDK